MKLKLRAAALAISLILLAPAAAQAVKLSVTYALTVQMTIPAGPQPAGMASGFLKVEYLNASGTTSNSSGVAFQGPAVTAASEGGSSSACSVTSLRDD